jgi:cellobiose-specific phosphotransferase system component IIA
MTISESIKLSIYWLNSMRSSVAIPVFLLITLTQGIFFPVARAANTPECDLQTLATKLETVRKNESGAPYLELIKQELLVRKEMLAKTISCADYEAASLEKSLNDISSNSDRVKSLRNQLARRLAEARSYYALQSQKIESLGLRGSQDMARDIREWRLNTYAALEQKIAVFLLWAANQDLLDTAGNRFHQISQAVRNLKLTESEDVRKALEAAEQSLEQAKKIHQDAEIELDAFDVSKDSLPMVKDALTALSETYEKFLEVSKAVTTVIPAAANRKQ